MKLSVPTTGVNNRDEDYNTSELSAETVTVDIEPDLPTVRMELPGSLTIRENSEGMYTVRLSANPGGNGATVHVKSTDEGRVTVSPSSLTFSETDWREEQPVTVSVLRDENAVEESVALQHRWSDEGPVVKTLAVRIDELDTKGVTVFPADLEIGEGSGAGDTYTLVLESKPENDKTVTVTISSSSANVIVDPSQLNFTEKGISQPVTVTAIEDKDAEPNASATLTHTVRGADYDNVRVEKVTVTVREEDTHGLTIIPDELGLTEGGSDGTYTVRLNSKPTGTVTIQLRSDSNDLIVKPSQLKFTTGDWSVDQTVRVTPEHDDDGENDPTVTITHRASGGGYNRCDQGRDGHRYR